MFLDPSDIYELHAVCLMGIDCSARPDSTSKLSRRTSAASCVAGFSIRDHRTRAGGTSNCTLMTVPTHSRHLVFPVAGQRRLGRLAMVGVAAYRGTVANLVRRARPRGRERRCAGSCRWHSGNDVPYIPMGQYSQKTAWRRTIADMPFGFPLFYGVRPA